MRTILFNVQNDTDDDSFCKTGDYETALRAAREVVRERPTETILITYKGFPLREFRLAADGHVVEEELGRPEAVDETILALTPQGSVEQP